MVRAVRALLGLLPLARHCRPRMHKYPPLSLASLHAVVSIFSLDPISNLKAVHHLHQQHRD